MSMHGRIYVDKNITLEKTRQRELKRHYIQLDNIKSNRNSSMGKQLRDISISTD